MLCFLLSITKHALNNLAALLYTCALQLNDLPLKPMPAVPHALQQQSEQAVANALLRVPTETKEKSYVSVAGLLASL